MNRPRVLFLCTHNSVRSQMAEGLLRTLGGDRFEVHSAGTVASGVNPEAIRAMAEIGIDIRDQTSKTFERYRTQQIDWVITVCDDAAQACPSFPGQYGAFTGPCPIQAALRAMIGSASLYSAR